MALQGDGAGLLQFDKSGILGRDAWPKFSLCGIGRGDDLERFFFLDLPSLKPHCDCIALLNSGRAIFPFTGFFLDPDWQACGTERRD